MILNLKRVSKYQDFSSKSFLSMYCVRNIMLLCAVNNSSSYSHGDFWMLISVTSIVSVGLFLLKRLQD